MRDLYPHTARFLRSLHRRFFWIRLAERVGVCLASVAALALLMVPLLRLGGHSGLPFCLTVFGGAIATGIGWGIARRPSILDAAMLADEQLRLHDLLGTAVLLTPTDASPTDAWQKTILALADARCRELTASDVLFHRWGGRAWGSTGLLVVLAMTLAVLTINPNPTAARQTAAVFAPTPLQQTITAAPDRDNSHGPAAPSAPRAVRPSPSMDDRDISPPSEAFSSQEAPAVGHQPADDPSGTPASTAADDAARGAGSATGRQIKPLTMLPPNSVGPSPAKSQNSTSNGGGGAGSASTAADATDSKSGTTAGSQTRRSPSAPWQTASWPADRQHAQTDARDRHLPDTYRNLIADYFRED